MAQNDPDKLAESSKTDSEKTNARKAEAGTSGASPPSEPTQPPRAPRSIDAGVVKASGGAASPLSSTTGVKSPFETANDAPAHDLSNESEATEPPIEPYVEPPRRRSGFSLGRILLALIALVAVFVGAAFVFKDKDERLRAVADAIENAVRNPQAFFAALQDKSSGPLNGKTTSHPSLAVKEAAPLSETQPSESTAPATPEGTASTPPQSDAKPAEAPPEKSAEAPQPSTPSRAPTPAAPEAEPAPPPREAQIDNRDALVKRVDRLEQVAQSALKAAEEARAARASESADKSDSLSERDYLVALEGRIDELANEIKSIREKLEAPKSELRAPQESAEAKSQAAAKKGNSAELVVVAQSLAQEVEKGKPYAVELAALTALGADSELLSALAPAAEKGAMTPEQLRHGFEPVAKRIQAIESPQSTGSYVDHMMRSLGRLVRVRPVNEAPSSTISDRVETIRSALAHNDVAGAAAAFDLLPDAAKTEESAFGELLRQRRDAEKASAAILSGAIAALGRNKS